MLLRIDHAIVGVPDLERSGWAFERLGLVVGPAGEHPGRGTANRLIVFGLDYLELITVIDPEPAPRALVRLLEHGEGLVNFALATDDLDAEVAAIRARGVEVWGPLRGRRRASDGSERSWRYAFVEPPDEWSLPFIIEHDSSEAERAVRLAGPGGAPRHALGVRRIARVDLAVPSLDLGLARYARPYGLTPIDRAPVAPLGAERARLPLRDAAIDLYAPNGAGLIAQRLAGWGAGPWRLVLAVESLAAAGRALSERGAPHGPALDEPGLWVPASAAAGAELLLVE